MQLDSVFATVRTTSYLFLRMIFYLHDSKIAPTVLFYNKNAAV